MLYTVKITEILSAKITVESDCEEDALEEVKAQYYGCDIILSSENYNKTTFEITEAGDDN